MSQNDIDTSVAAIRNDTGMSPKVSNTIADIAQHAPAKEDNPVGASVTQFIEWLGIGHDHSFATEIKDQLQKEEAEVKANPEMAALDASSSTPDALTKAIVATAGKADAAGLARLTDEVTALLAGKDITVSKSVWKDGFYSAESVHKTYTADEVKALMTQISTGQKEIEESRENPLTPFTNKAMFTDGQAHVEPAAKELRVALGEVVEADMSTVAAQRTPPVKSEATVTKAPSVLGRN